MPRKRVKNSHLAIGKRGGSADHSPEKGMEAQTNKERGNGERAVEAMLQREKKKGDIKGEKKRQRRFRGGATKRGCAGRETKSLGGAGSQHPQGGAGKEKGCRKSEK